MPVRQEEIKVYNELVRSVREYYSQPSEYFKVLRDWDTWPLETLRGVVQIQLKQQRLWVIGFPRWLANVYGNCPDVEVRRILLEDMDDEDFRDSRWHDGHVGLQRRLAFAVGLEDEDLDEGPFCAEVLANYHAMENISRTWPWLEAVACLMGTECLTLNNMVKLYPDMEELETPGITGPAMHMYRKLGLKTEDLAFFWAHDLSLLEEWETGKKPQRAKGAEAKHQAHIIRTLTERAVADVEKRRVVKAVKTGHAIYRLRWEGVGRAIKEYLESGFTAYGPNAWNRK